MNPVTPADTLKACPWCESPMDVLRKSGWYRLECSNENCPVLPGTKFYDSKAALFAAWNTRKEPANG